MRELKELENRLLGQRFMPQDTQLALEQSKQWCFVDRIMLIQFCLKR